MHDKKKIFQAIYKLLSYNYIVLRKAVVETYYVCDFISFLHFFDFLADW